MILNIAICDDEIISIEKLADKVKDYCKEKNTQYAISVYRSGEELLSDNTDEFDIIFLDVDMHELNGIDAAREIRKKNKEVLIVYVSGYVQYAPLGYGVKAFAYLLKNDMDILFCDVMDNLFSELKIRNEVFRIKTDKENISLPLKEIIFIESFDKTVDIHIVNGKKYTAKAQINDIYCELKSKGFLQIHKSYIVNMQHIIRIKNYIVTLSDGRELMASQRRWKDMVSDYLEWKGRM